MNLMKITIDFDQLRELLKLPPGVEIVSILPQSEMNLSQAAFVVVDNSNRLTDNLAYNPWTCKWEENQGK